MIIGKGISKTFIGDPLFTNLNFKIENNKKEKYESKKIKEINFNPGITHSKLMVRFSNVSKSYDNENFIFKDLDFEIRGGEKVWLFGPKANIT